MRQTLVGLWAGVETRWTDKFRTEIGARFDTIDYDVDSDLEANSGSGSDDLTSPKLSMVFGPWADTEIFVAGGQGFHGNDIRGATITVDPVDGVTPVEQVTPLVEAEGMEAGIRTALIPRTQLSLALWQLEIDSELLFIGDGGATEASRPSRRRGVELGVYSRPTDWMILDADLAWSEPRFSDNDPAGDRIPGAVERVASLGLTLDAGQDLVWGRAPAIPRTLCAHRGQQRSGARHAPRESRGRDADQRSPEAAARAVQRARQRRERHPVLL